jgi:cobalt/nickel transport system permease protein
VPVGPGSAHLLLIGPVGFLLGWSGFVAVAAALPLQAVLFGHGGLTVLGPNVLAMGSAAVTCHYLFARRLRTRRSGRFVAAMAFGAGVGGVAMGCGIQAALLALSGREFLAPAAVLLAAHLPVMVAEGFIAAAAVSFLRRVRPELIGPVIRATVD